MLHRAHDYQHLVTRWRAVARESGLKLRRLARDDGFDLFYLQTQDATPGLYVSAGIHGDEPAAPEALIQWAEHHTTRLSSWPLLIFPCLNPWGLRNNIRTDSRGRDVNRLFHGKSHPVVAAVRRVVKDRRFAVSLSMHEDYDAQGTYLYEVQRGTRHLGEKLLGAARRILPPDPRPRIDGRKAEKGLIRRRIAPRTFEKIGYPEAIWLHLHHSDYTFTFETPSEADLGLRVSAHIAVIEQCLAIAIATRALRAIPGSAPLPPLRTAGARRSRSRP
ncbi:MAG: M14 family metallocarboxypeptidase [Chthoniobacteraceae bacterium]